jgi:hypothetical protein
MKHALRVGLLVAVVLAASTCGAGRGEPFAEQYGSLEPGRYFTTKFEPTLSFEVGEGWRVHVAEEPTNFTIVRSQAEELTFANPTKVYHPTSPDKLVSAPERAAEWVSWFREHPYLETSKPELESVGGLEGERFDTTTSPPADYVSKRCGGDVSPWPVRSGPDECFDRQENIRVIVLDNVEGEAVLVVISAIEGATFEEFLPKAQGVLDTVEWQGA